jgi:hypothetical protein
MWLQIGRVRHYGQVCVVFGLETLLGQSSLAIFPEVWSRDVLAKMVWELFFIGLFLAF